MTEKRQNKNSFPFFKKEEISILPKKTVSLYTEDLFKRSAAARKKLKNLINK